MTFPLREQWPWNSAYLRMFLIAPAAVGIALAIFYYPIGGAQAAWFLLGIPVGMLLRLMFGSAANRVEKLKQDYANDPGEVAEGLLVVGKIQSPGVAILRADELQLVPIAGEAFTIPLASLRILKEGRMLPGKYVWGKHAFILEPNLDTRLGFAVAESTGRRWSTVLRNS